MWLVHSVSTTWSVCKYVMVNIYVFVEHDHADAVGAFCLNYICMVQGTIAAQEEVRRQEDALLDALRFDRGPPWPAA